MQLVSKPSLLKFFKWEIAILFLCVTFYVFYIFSFLSTEVQFLASFQGDVQLVDKFFNGSLFLKDLVRRFGEHGMLGYDVLLIINALLFHLSSRFDMLLNILNAIICGILIVYCASQTFGEKKNIAYYAGIALMTVVMFSPMQGSSATMETQVRLGMFFFIGGAFLVSNIILNKTSWFYLILASFIIFIGTDVFGTLYNFAGLPTIFLLLLLFSMRNRKTNYRYYLIALTYILASLIYLWMYGLIGNTTGLQSTSISQGIVYWLAHPLVLIKSILAYNASAVLGVSGFLIASRHPVPGIPFFLLAGLSITCINLFSLFLYVKTKMYQKTVFPVILMGYSFFVLILAIIGRFKYGADWTWGTNIWYHVHTKFGLAASLWIILDYLGNTVSSFNASPLTWPNKLLPKAAWISFIIIAFGLISGISATLYGAAGHAARIQKISDYMFSNAANIPVDKDGNTPFLVDKATTLKCLQILKEHKLSVFSKHPTNPGLKLTKQNVLLSGSFYSDGWIGKEFAVKLPTNRQGSFWGEIFLPNDKFVPNGITITINGVSCYSQKFSTPGSHFFCSTYTPTNNDIVKVQMEKVIVPKEVGLGQDERPLSGILTEFVIE